MSSTSSAFDQASAKFGPPRILTMNGTVAERSKKLRRYVPLKSLIFPSSRLVSLLVSLVLFPELRSGRRCRMQK